jgi:hypothetical protein
MPTSNTPTELVYAILIDRKSEIFPNLDSFHVFSYRRIIYKVHYRLYNHFASLTRVSALPTILY